MILLNHLILLCILSHPNLITATPPSNSIRARYLFSSTTSSSIDPVYSNSTKIFPTIANLSSSSSSSTVLQGRYGHSTTYLASSNQLYFIGGQFGDTGTQISNQILVFNLNQDYPASSNPRVDPIVSLLLPPNAWGAITTDTAQRIWSIGGITQNCEKDSIAYVLAGEAWIAVRATPHPPPRRRQAQGVTVRNTVSKLDEIWVFGGIAEPFTCSLETIGYLGYDRWSVGKVSESSATMIVESSEWIAPVGTVEHYSPPVSDFTATLLQDGSNIVVIGGQSSDGVLLSMKQILVFDTTSGVWSLQTASGEIPTQRIGHVAVRLPSGSILIHGGLGIDHDTVADLHLLSPPSTHLTESTSTSTTWTWSTPSSSPTSLAIPARAWHSASVTATGTIIVAFGIDTVFGNPSTEISFLRIDEPAGEYTWSSAYNAATEQAILLALTNPKASTTTSISPLLSSTTSISAPTIIPVIVSTTSASHTTPSSSSTTVPASSSTGTTSDDTLASSQAILRAATEKKNAIAGSLGAICGLLVVIIIGFFLRRRYYSSSTSASPSERRRSYKTRSFFSGRSKEVEGDDVGGGGVEASFTGPLVSNLMYTRPKVGRHLSLGSEASGRSQRSTSPDLDLGNFGQLDGTPSPMPRRGKSNSSRSSGAGGKEVSELGQYTVESSSISSPPTTTPTTTTLSPPNETVTSIHSTVSSVASYPFLGMLQRNLSNSTTHSNTSIASDRTLLRSPVPLPPPLSSNGNTNTNNGLLNFLSIRKKPQVWDLVMGAGLEIGAPSVRPSHVEDETEEDSTSTPEGGSVPSVITGGGGGERRVTRNSMLYVRNQDPNSIV